MFRERLISGIIMVMLIVITIFSGGYILLGMVTLISLIGLMEIYRVENIHKSILGITGYLACIGLSSLLILKKEEHVFMLLIMFFLLLVAIYVLTFPKFKSSNLLMAFFGFFYIVVMLSYIFRLRTMEDGLILTGLIFISAWGCDTCAYCVGMLIGRHKLAPKLSPKKSIEGSIGGILGAVLLGIIYALILKENITKLENPVLVFAIICGLGSVISQIGDLMASAIKRNYNIKDYGNLIPGHGGILDRFDSIIVTAPVIYFLALFLR